LRDAADQFVKRSTRTIGHDDGGSIIADARAFEDIALVNPTLGRLETLTRVRQKYHALARSEQAHIDAVPAKTRR